MSLRLLLEKTDEEAYVSDTREDEGDPGQDLVGDNNIKGANISLITVSPDRSKIAICRSKESTALYIYSGLHSLLDRTHISELKSSQNIAKDLYRHSRTQNKNLSSALKKTTNKKTSTKALTYLSSCTKYRIPEELTNEKTSEDEEGEDVQQENTIRSNLISLKWISTSHLALGFESGLLRVIDCNGEEIYSVRFERSPIVSIKSYPTQALSEYESDIWIMFKSSTIVILPYYTIAALNDSKIGIKNEEESNISSATMINDKSPSSSKTSSSDSIKGKPVISPSREMLLANPIGNKLNYKIYRFGDHLEVLDYGVFPKLPPYFSHTAQTQTLSTYLSNFISSSAPTTTYLLSGGSQTSFNLMSTSPDNSSDVYKKDNICILCGGTEPTFGFYTLGESQGIRGLGEVVNIVKKKITQAVVGTVGSILPWVGGNLLFGNSSNYKTKIVDPYSPEFSISKSRTKFETATDNGKVGIQERRMEISRKRESSTQSKTSNNVDPTLLHIDSNMNDKPRQILSVTVDPSNRLAACCDNLGRVILIDLWSKMILRLWKGCRDAQVAWMEVLETMPPTDLYADSDLNFDKVEIDEMYDSRYYNPARFNQGAAHKSKLKYQNNNDTGSVGLYLAIYAARRQTINVYRMRNGPCVTSINIGTTTAQIFTVPHIRNSLSEATFTQVLILKEYMTVKNSPLKEKGQEDQEISAVHFKSGLKLYQLELDSKTMNNLIMKRAMYSDMHDTILYHKFMAMLTNRQNSMHSSVHEYETENDSKVSNSFVKEPQETVKKMGDPDKEIKETIDISVYQLEQKLLDIIAQIKSPRIMTLVLKELDNPYHFQRVTKKLNKNFSDENTGDNTSNSNKEISVYLSFMKELLNSVDFQRQATLLMLDNLTTSSNGSSGASSLSMLSSWLKCRSKLLQCYERLADTDVDDFFNSIYIKERKDSKNDDLSEDIEFFVRPENEVEENSVDIKPFDFTGEENLKRHFTSPSGKYYKEAYDWIKKIHCQDDDTFQENEDNDNNSCHRYIKFTTRKYTDTSIKYLALARFPSIPEFLNAFDLKEGEDEGSRKIYLPVPDTMDTNCILKLLKKPSISKYMATLNFLMRPFLADTFSYQVIEDVMGTLTWSNSDILAYFSTWFMTLPIELASLIILQKNTQNSPLLRWLSNIMNQIAEEECSKFEKDFKRIITKPQRLKEKEERRKKQIENLKEKARRKIMETKTLLDEDETPRDGTETESHEAGNYDTNAKQNAIFNFSDVSKTAGISSDNEEVFDYKNDHDLDRSSGDDENEDNEDVIEESEEEDELENSDLNDAAIHSLASITYGDRFLDPLFSQLRNTCAYEHAFLFATTCYDFIVSIASKWEKKSLGLIGASREAVGFRWNCLLRQLRTCLLFSHRLGLYASRRPSVRQMDRGFDFSKGNFSRKKENEDLSIYSLLAADLLTFCTAVEDKEKLTSWCATLQHRRHAPRHLRGPTSLTYKEEGMEVWAVSDLLPLEVTFDSTKKGQILDLKNKKQIENEKKIVLNPWAVIIETAHVIQSGRGKLKTLLQSEILPLHPMLLEVSTIIANSQKKQSNEEETRNGLEKVNSGVDISTRPSYDIPLLTFFSYHNQPAILSAHIAKHLISLWTLDQGKSKLLLTVSQHINSIRKTDPKLAASLSWHILAKYILPVFKRKFLLGWYDKQRKASDNNLQSVSVAFPTFLGSSKVADIFLNSTLTLITTSLRYEEDELQAEKEKQNKEYMTLHDTKQSGDQSSQKAQLQEEKPSNKLEVSGIPSPTHEIWPSNEDTWIDSLVEEYCDPLNPKYIGTVKQKIFTLYNLQCLLVVIQTQMATSWWTIHPISLFQCTVDEITLGSKLFEVPPVSLSSGSESVSETINVKLADRFTIMNSTLTPYLKERRTNFILNSLEKLNGTSNYSILYRLVELWFSPEEIDYIRRGHIILLMHQNHDILVEEMLVLINIKFIDSLTKEILEIIRARLYAVLKKIEDVRGYNKLLATIDPELYNWILETNLSISVNLSVSKDRNKMLEEVLDLMTRCNVVLSKLNTILPSDSVNVRMVQELMKVSSAINNCLQNF